MHSKSIRFADARPRGTIRPAATGLLMALIGMLPACQTQRQSVAQHEDQLAAAGFVLRPANTPERRAMLTRLPAHRFVKRVKGDDVQYVYADPLVCACLYVGSQQAYGSYQQSRQDRQRIKQLTQELQSNQHAAEDDDLNAQIYSDSAWSWSAWGPWGPEYGYPATGW